MYSKKYLKIGICEQLIIQSLSSPEINECFKSPCLEGSKCKDVIGTYECTCRDGYEYDLEHGCVG